MNAQNITPKKHWQHATNPARRLEYYKALAAHRVETDWRKYRWEKPAALISGKYAVTWGADLESIYVGHMEACPFHFEGEAGDLTRLDHTGWYADQYCGELVKGAVVSFRNPRRMYGTDGDDNGMDTHKVYLAAYYFTASEGGTIDFSSYYETKRDAARAADRLAERAAEDNREFSARDAAECEQIEARAEIHELNREGLALIGEIKKAGLSYTPAVCDAIRSKLGDILSTRRAKFKRLQELSDNYWTAVTGY
jgi:hypothetical protein